MILPYFGRLLCLSLASFFLLHLALAAVVAAMARRAVAKAERMRPRAGARLLLALRLLPAGLATLAVAGIFVPGYLWFEPEAEAERIGVPCLAAAVAGAVVCGAGIARGTRAAIRSSRYLNHCERALESDALVLMVGGVFRPRLVISQGARKALAPDQLAVAVRHERAHAAARDNLKRLLMRLAPDALPFVRGFASLERGWSRLAEWAADDQAVAGSLRRSLALASALVQIARRGAGSPSAVGTSLVGDINDLAVRVDRLLYGGADDEVPARRLWVGAILAVCALVVAIQPATLAAAHRAWEALAH